MIRFMPALRRDVWTSHCGLRATRVRRERFFACIVVLLAVVIGCDHSPGGGSTGAKGKPPAEAATLADGDPAPIGRSAAPSQTERIQLAIAAAQNRDWKAAKENLNQQLIADPADTRLQQTLAKIAMQQGDLILAIELLRSVIEIDPQAPLPIYQQLAEWTVAAGQPFETVALYESLSNRHPNAVEERFALAGLASMLGLESSVLTQLKWLAQHNRGDDESLVVLAQPAQVEPDAELCKKILQMNPDDLRPHYGLAKLDAMHQRWDEVVDRLAPVIEKHPQFIPALVLYGRGLAEVGDEEKMQQWLKTVPAEAKSTADYWLAKGAWADRRGNYSVAAEAFYEAAILEHANQAETITRLTRALQRIGMPDQVTMLAQRNQQLTRLHQATKTLYERSSRSQQFAFKVADSMTQLDRPWEAEAWARLALRLPDDRVPDAKDRYLASRSRLTATTPWQSIDWLEKMRTSILELTVDPSRDASPNPKDGPRRSITSNPGQIYFRDVAGERGLVHRISLNSEGSDGGLSISESSGGGAAVIDFDLDGWPDVALSQLSGSPLQNDSDANLLFRNHRSNFTDVAGPSGFIDRGFSQGISACDYNNDGFPDLFVSNIGRNRLFKNQGDGTFEDVSDEAGLGGQAWTVSSAVADINGDGHSDIFETNYCAGGRAYEKQCRSRETGQPVSCTPLDFDAEPDRAWAGRGDGTFVDVTQTWIRQTDAGRGLGVLAANLDDSPGLDLFVANDMSSNHLWSSMQSSSDALDKDALDKPDASDNSDASSAISLFAMRESGIASGVALSGRSFSQASMGIAHGDPDHDGDLDLFVTHFHDDYNTLYEQISPGLWADHSHRADLAEPSMKLLGFGTQFADFDNDGNLELIVANGHVGDFGKDDTPFKMPPQLFRLKDDLRWEELDRSQLGDYFSVNHLGRAVAILDADRDGRSDVLITGLMETTALLRNESKPAKNQDQLGKSVGMILVATESQRDAVGAVVRARVGDRMHYAQVTAGDGFMCTNQRRLAVGLGDDSVINEVTIEWPSGQKQTHLSIGAGADYLFVEGQQEPFRLFDHSF